MRKNLHAGFSLIEIIIVLGLAGIMLSIGLVMSQGSIARSSVTQERDLFVSLLLAGARAQALANIDETPHGIHVDNDDKEYVLFDGANWNTSDPDTHRVTPFTNPNIIIERNGVVNNFNIVFDQLSANVSTGTGTIAIKHESSDIEQLIVINEVGQINW